MKLFRWIKHRMLHKLEHVSWTSIKKTFRDHGLALVIIIVGWEIIEDILFPILFIWLGSNVHPVFLAGAPASLLLCLHWVAVPALWGLWMKISNQAQRKDD